MNDIQELFNSTAMMFDALDRFSVATTNREAALQQVKALTPLQGKTVLDIGCGTGTWSQVLTQAGAVVSGIDFAENMISIARKKHPSISFQTLEADQINILTDNAFDIVTASFVLHDIPRPQRRNLLYHMKRVGKEWVILFDYGQLEIPFMPAFYEYFEGNRYKQFVEEIVDDLQEIFEDSQKLPLKKGGALYYARCY